MQTTQSPLNVHNPWLTMWIHPRKTIRHIVDTNPEHRVILIAVLAGIFRVIDNLAERSAGDLFNPMVMIGFVLFFGSVGGIISVHINGILFGWSGRLLGGQAENIQVRAAAAWSSLPTVLMLLIYIPIIATFGLDWFISSPVWIVENPSSALVLISSLVVVGVILLGWRLVLFVQSLAEVHQLPSWKGLTAAVVGVLAIVIPFAVLFFGFRLLV